MDTPEATKLHAVRTKDGITITDIPEGIPDNAPELAQRAAIIRASRNSSAPVSVSYQDQPQKAIGAMGEASVPAPSMLTGNTMAGKTDLTGLLGAVERPLIPATMGAAIGGLATGRPEGALGGAAIASLVFGAGDLLVPLINKMLGTKYTSPSDALNDYLTKAGFAIPDSEFERIVQSVSTGVAGAIGGVGAGTLLKAGAPALGMGTASQGVGEVLASQAGRQVIGGAGAGAASATAGELGAPPLLQTAAGVAGGALAAGVAAPRTTVGAQRAEGLISDAERAGVKMMTSDIIPPKTFPGKWLQAAGEKVPIVGTAGPRAAQQAQRVDAVRNTLRDFGADDVSSLSDDVMRDLAARRSRELDRWSGMKKSVIEGNSMAGAVPVPKTTEAIDAQIGRLQALKTKEVQPVIDRLNDWKTAVQDQNLANVETLRKQLGESFKAPELAGVRTTGEKALSSIYGSLREDMGNFIKANGKPNDYNKWQVANKELAKMIGEASDTALGSVLKRGDATPEVVNKLLFSKKPSEVRLLYSNLTEEGRANARAAILAKAAEGATTFGDKVSPDRFANEVRKLGNSTGVFFSGEDAKAVEGLVRVLDATKRASQASVMPPTGIQTLYTTGLLGMGTFFGRGIKGFIATAGAAGGVGAMARLYESAAVRNILIRIPSVKVGSSEETALFKRLIATMYTQKEDVGKIPTMPAAAEEKNQRAKEQQLASSPGAN